MPSTLIKTNKKTFSGVKLAQYVNDKKGTEFSNIAQAVTGLGVTVVGAAITNPVGSAIATALGLGIAYTAVRNAVIEGMDPNSLSKTLKKMKKNDELLVMTSFYQYLTGSGNHSAYYTKVTYLIITPV